jgi:DnaJ like chaperone protein
MLLGWHPMAVWLCAAAGVLVGHFSFDREPPWPKSESPRPIEPFLAEEHPRPKSLRSSSLGRRQPRKGPASDQAALVEALAPLFVELARIDGDVVGDEVRAVRHFFEKLGYDEAGLELVRVAMKEAMATPTQDLATLVKAKRGFVKPAMRVEVLRALYEVALADSEMKRSERDALRHVVEHFNLSEEQLRVVTADFFGSGAEHFAALGLLETASDDEIRSAFRRLAAENHPDRVASLGAAAAAEAAERFRVVKEAYEALKQLRGL